MRAPAPRNSSWPKQRPTLSDPQRVILEDWYVHWLTVALPRYGSIVRFNHQYPAASAVAGTRTLEIGAGTGEHLVYENLNQQEYFALELREELAARLASRFPAAKVIIGDCEKNIDAPDGFFDRVLAIHVLEHLANLPIALQEVARVLKPSGTFSVVIPCEGGVGYQIGRQFSSKRQFEKRYGVSYEWMISYEHVNRADEIIHELEAVFIVKDKTYFPFRVPSVHLNLVLGLTMKARPKA
jgi:SAM-dependent methyltransferase